MDRLSVKVLRFLRGQDSPVHEDEIVRRFGPEARKSLDFLKKGNYILEGKAYGGMSFDESGRAHRRYVGNSQYEIDSAGRDFLEAKPGVDFDRWLNRLDVIGSILGGALLSKPLWALIEWIAALLQN